MISTGSVSARRGLGLVAARSSMIAGVAGGVPARASALHS
jgi:hypothetical protein